MYYAYIVVNVFVQKSLKHTKKMFRDLYKTSRNKFLTVKQIDGQRLIVNNRLDSLNHAIKIVRDWLRVSSGEKGIDGHIKIVKDYREFRQKMPGITTDSGLDINELTFTDYCLMVEEALSINML